MWACIYCNELNNDDQEFCSFCHCKKDNAKKGAKRAFLLVTAFVAVIAIGFVGVYRIWGRPDPLPSEITPPVASQMISSQPIEDAAPNDSPSKDLNANQNQKSDNQPVDVYPIESAAPSGKPSDTALISELKNGTIQPAVPTPQQQSIETIELTDNLDDFVDNYEEYESVTDQMDYDEVGINDDVYTEEDEPYEKF